MKTVVVLYKALQTVGSLDLPAGESASGAKFEDYMVRQLYEKLRQQTEFRVFPPRYTLHEATFSGCHHQFDIVVAEQDEFVAIECKFRRGAHIDQLFATEGKLVDYRKRPRGVFVTTARSVNDEMYCYALAHQLLLISTFGSSTVNRGHEHHLAMSAFSALERLPRCSGSSQRGGGTR